MGGLSAGGILHAGLLTLQLVLQLLYRDRWVCLWCLVFVQSDREKSEGLPVAAFMDREKVTKPTAQIGFIKFVLIPMFETVMKVSKISNLCCSFKYYFYFLHHLLTLICSSQLFPQIEEIMVQPLRDSRDHYEELKQIDDAMTEVNVPHSHSLSFIVCNIVCNVIQIYIQMYVTI